VLSLISNGPCEKSPKSFTGKSKSYFPSAADTLVPLGTPKLSHVIPVSSQAPVQPVFPPPPLVKSVNKDPAGFPVALLNEPVSVPLPEMGGVITLKVQLSAVVSKVKVFNVVGSAATNQGLASSNNCDWP